MLKRDKKIRNEEAVSKHINVLCHYDDETLIDKSGKLIKLIKLNGIDIATQSAEAREAFKNQRNNLFKSFSSEFALYFCEIRRKVSDYPEGKFSNEFAKQVNSIYENKIKTTEMFHKELYLAIITKHPEGVINKGFQLIKQLSYGFDKSAKEIYLKKRHQELNQLTDKVLSSLSDYKPSLLTSYQKNQNLLSAPLEFLSQIINFDKHTVPVALKDAAKEVLPCKRISFNNKSGTIEIRDGAHQRKFAAVLSIKGYSPVTFTGMLDELSCLPIESTLVQSFRSFDRHVAKTKLRDQQKDMMQSKEESIRQTDQIDEAFDDTASGEVGYGWHHLTLTCFADSIEELNQHVATLIARFSDMDMTCVREDVACEAGFWAQLPGNFAYILRAAVISTKNVASLSSLHNTAKGKLSGNHWGPAVTVLETITGSPYYFNFHYKDVGNFLVFGAMGSGKTVLVGFLILQSLKFGGKRVIFDKDRGLEIMVRASYGVYERIKPGVPTGFNPCQLDNTSENRQFLVSLLKKILSPMNESETAQIELAIDGMYRLEKCDRQFCHLAPFLGTRRVGSLRNRFDEWHSDGSHAWLFDNAVDRLNLEPDLLGFDLGSILNQPETKIPAFMYLTHRVEQVISGQRGMLFIDEGWQVLQDNYFKSLIEDWSRTPRKKNNIFGLATQVAADTVCFESKAIIESAFCKIVYPNPSASKAVYVDGLGLSLDEYHLIKTMPDDQHYFLLNHGRSTNKESVIVRLNLKKQDELLAILSAREDSLLLMDQVCAEVGNDPAIWVPIFHERRRLQCH